jgi:threonine dehydratase
MEIRKVYFARNLIRGLVRKTPLEYSPFLSEFCGGDVWLKLENQQLTGSFKIRGALNKLLQLSAEERIRGVITASSGNHAQGIGYSAKEIGVKSKIVVPRNTPLVKIEAIKRYGVELVVDGEEYMDAEMLARKMQRDENKTFVSAYNDIDIIAGQGTVGLEMIEDHPKLDVVLVPVGGGGLVSGVGCVLKATLNEVDVLGVQSEASPVMAESIKQGRIIEMDLDESIAEGLHGGIEEGSITFSLCNSLVDGFILVREETINEAIRLLLIRQHQVVEGAGAVGVSAIMENPERFRGRRVGILISGGNIDNHILKELVCT